MTPVTHSTTPGGWDSAVLLSLFRGCYAPSRWVFSVGYHWDKVTGALSPIIAQISTHYEGRQAGPVYGEPHLLFWYPSGNLSSAYFADDKRVGYEDVQGDPEAFRGQLWAQELIARWNQAQMEEQVQRAKAREIDKCDRPVNLREEAERHALRALREEERRIMNRVPALHDNSRALVEEMYREFYRRRC
jgi:hypothetical protein